MNLSNKQIILLFIGIIGTFVLSVLIGGAVFWGLGNLIIYAFKLEYTWSFLQGLCVSLATKLLIPSPLKMKIDTISKREDSEKNEERTSSENT